MELPHLTVMTKCDLVQDKSILENFNEVDPKTLISELNPYMGKKLEKLTNSLINLVLFHM